MERDWPLQIVPRALLKVESDKLDVCLPKLHGHYFLQYSALSVPILRASTLQHGFYVGQELGEGQLDMDFQQLPFRDNSLDCVLAHHVLDYDASPHQCLREAARVVVPNGYLVLVGFNPWSALGISRMMPKSILPIKGRYLSRRRVQDWLTLLGFRVEQVESCQFLPPSILKYFPGASVRIDAMLNYMGLPFGGVNILVARKLVAGRTPIRPQWRALAGRAVSVNTSASTRAVNRRGRRVPDR